MMEKEKTAAAVNTASQFGTGVLRPGTLKVTVGQEVSNSALHEIVDTIVRLHGCAPCGLGGLDILIRQQDPLLSDAFRKIPAVTDVALHR